MTNSTGGRLIIAAFFMVIVVFIAMAMNYQVAGNRATTSISKDISQSPKE